MQAEEKLRAQDVVDVSERRLTVLYERDGWIISLMTGLHVLSKDHIN